MGAPFAATLNVTGDGVTQSVEAYYGNYFTMEIIRGSLPQDCSSRCRIRSGRLPALPPRPVPIRSPRVAAAEGLYQPAADVRRETAGRAEGAPARCLLAVGYDAAGHDIEAGRGENGD